MGCLGVHFAISAEGAAQLLAANDDAELVAIVDEIEDEWELVHETDKAWDALHRCLSNGTLHSGEGDAPLNRVFFGGQVLNTEEEFFVVLITPAEVKELAVALAAVTEPWLKHRYFNVPFPDYQGEKSDDDWEYTKSNFDGLPAFFAQAATADKYVIFTVSQ